MISYDDNFRLGVDNDAANEVFGAEIDTRDQVIRWSPAGTHRLYSPIRSSHCSSNSQEDEDDIFLTVLPIIVVKPQRGRLKVGSRMKKSKRPFSGPRFQQFGRFDADSRRHRADSAAKRMISHIGITQSRF